MIEDMNAVKKHFDNQAIGLAPLLLFMLPVLEPSNQQEAYDMVYEGFELSEKLGYPILLRITTRMAHSRAGVVTRTGKEQNAMHTPEDGRQRYILLPALARKRFRALIAAQDHFNAASEESKYNQYFEGADKSLGIITTGIAFNYLSENYPEGFAHPVLKITQYPLPRKKVEKLVDECHEILVLEEGYPVVEEQLKGFLNRGIKIHDNRLLIGKKSGIFPSFQLRIGHELIQNRLLPKQRAYKRQVGCRNTYQPHVYINLLCVSANY